MTSFINVRRRNVAIEIIPQGTAFCYSFAVSKLPFSLRCLQYMVTSILQDKQYMFGVKSLLVVEKVLLMRNNLVAVLFRRPMQRSQRSIPSCGQTGMWWDVYMNLDDTLKNET